jgi:RNA polymerase sigma factor (sigma-70 family)
VPTNPVSVVSTPDPDPIDGLIRAAAAGDSAAWAELIRRYTPLVRSRMASYRLQEADRLDVAQTVWLRLAENLPRLRTPAHLGGWLATVVARECQLLRRRAARSVVAGDLMTHVVADPAAGPDDLVADSDLACRLWSVVEKLPPPRRRLVRALFADEPQTYAEISRTTGIPIGGIGPTRGRAMRQLRTMLADDVGTWLKVRDAR